MPSSHRLEENQHYPTAIVTGGASFFGSALCDRLLSHQVEVVCVDQLSRAKKRNIKALENHPRFHLLSLAGSLNSLDRITRAHYIFHLAGTQDSNRQKSAKTKNLLTSPRAVKHLLDLAQKHSAKFLLASAVEPDHSFLSAQSLSHKIGPPTQQGNFYSLAETKRIAEALTAEAHHAHHLDARAVRLLDVYGPHMDLRASSPIASFLKAVKTGNPLEVRGDGLQKLYPTYITDSVEGVMKAMFTAGSLGKIFTLANPQAITEMNLAYAIRQLVPHRQEISFGKKASEIQEIDPAWLKNNLNWQPKVSLDEGLGQTLQWLSHLSAASLKFSPSASKTPKLRPLAESKKPAHLRSAPQLPPSKNQALPLVKPRKRFTGFKTFLSRKKARQPEPLPKTTSLSPPKKILAATLVAGLIALVSPFAYLATTSAIAVSSLKKTQELFLVADIKGAQASAEKSQTYFNRSEQTVTQLSRFSPLASLDEQLFRLEKLIQIGSNLATSSRHLTQAAVSLLGAGQIIIGTETGDPVSLTTAAQAETTRAYELLSLASAELQARRPNFESLKIFGIGESYRQVLEVVPQLRQTTATARTFLTVLPEIIGVGDQKKTYLVLLQNNAELRPTGGFIGSFALITFQNAKLLDFVIEDVYTADGALKGHVEPPPAIREHLGEASWYLRDVNWDPDFPSTARQAEWFLQKEIGRSVDGTIAINLYVVQNILEALGEAPLPDYNETITATNLFERAQYHSEVDFFPGSTQKKDFLAALTRNLYIRVQNLGTQEVIKLARALLRSTEEKQLLISFKDAPLAANIDKLNWAGQILGASDCAVGSCFFDYLALREANVGVNKANFFVKRKVDYHLQILKEDNLTATTTILFTNDSPAEAWPGGTYKNYLRLYVPQGSSLKSIAVDQRELAEEVIDISQEHGKTVFGFLVSVPIKSQTEVSVKYRLPGELKLKQGSPIAEYNLLIQKQSGTGSDPLTVTLTHPAYLQQVASAPKASGDSQTIKFTSDLTQDREFQITFTK